MGQIIPCEWWVFSEMRLDVCPGRCRVVLAFAFTFVFAETGRGYIRGSALALGARTVFMTAECLLAGSVVGPRGRGGVVGAIEQRPCVGSEEPRAAGDLEAQDGPWTCGPVVRMLWESRPSAVAPSLLCWGDSLGIGI